MNKNVILLLDILTTEQVYSLNKLKIKLAERNLNLKEDQIIELIVQTLYESICYFKMEKRDKCTKLYKCFKYLNASNNIKYLDNQKVEILNKTIDKINKKLDISNNPNNIYRENMEFLLKIKYNLELTILQFNNSDEIVDDKEKIEEVIYKFIFEIKNYNYIFEIFRTFPELINFKSHNNKYILDDVITKYIEILNMDNNDFDNIYYEKIIELFINSENFNVTKSYRDSLINRLLLVNNNLNINEYSRRKNKKIRFFINNIINKLSNIEITDKDEFFSNINYRYGIQDSYNGNFYDKYKSSNNIIINQHIIDMTNKYTFTVDNKSTQSFDDAFSIIKTKDGNYELSIYIADVTKSVLENSKLDQLALKKASTIYLPDYTLTMLPHSLTYDNCSLVKNTYRNVIAHTFLLSKNFDIISFDVKEAIIKVDDNFCYDDIEQILNSNDIEKLRIMSIMIDIASKIKRDNFYNTDYHIIKKIKREYDNPTEKILEKHQNLHTNFVDTFMILTNYFVSDLFKRLDYPFIYRVNSSDTDMELIEQIKQGDSSEISKQIIEHINELYRPSYYSNINLGHNGLKLNSYGHLTMPIRNYASLFSQRLEYKYLIENKKIDDKTIYSDESKIIEIVTYINDRIYYNEEYIKEYKKNYKKELTKKI